ALSAGPGGPPPRRVALHPPRHGAELPRGLRSCARAARRANRPAMKLLTFATLYPSAARPGHGIFVETRLRHLLASGAVQSVVVAPVPWFPAARKEFGRYGSMARTPRRETLHGIDVRHPRFPLVPQVGMSTAPFL